MSPITTGITPECAKTVSCLEGFPTFTINGTGVRDIAVHSGIIAIVITEAGV